MFKAKYKPTGEIFQVLDTTVDPVLGVTHFLVWNNGGWRWYSASNFVPPNYEEEKEKKK